MSNDSYVMRWIAESRRTKAILFQRFLALGIGLFGGALFALIVTFTFIPSDVKFSDRLFSWAVVMCGPFAGTGWGLLPHFWSFILPGWLGLLLIPLHAVRPNAQTFCATIFGFLMWYYSGFWSTIWYYCAG